MNVAVVAAFADSFAAVEVAATAAAGALGTVEESEEVGSAAKIDGLAVADDHVAAEIDESAAVAAEKS